MAQVGEGSDPEGSLIESEEAKVKDQLHTIYDGIRGVVFEANCLGTYSMTGRLTVYEIVSRDFKEKLASIVKQVEGLDTGKNVWRGISGPPEYAKYWLWASEDSDKGDTAFYQVTKIDVKYDIQSGYSVFVHMDVEEVVQ